MKTASITTRAAVAYTGYATAEEFDAGYSNFITPEVVSHWEKIFREASQRSLHDAPELRRLRYGLKGRNAIDFFPAAGNLATAPLLIAIHGGLWFLFDKWLMHFLAPAFNAAGIHVACINYGLAPDHRLGEIVEDCRNAVAHLAREAAFLGVDPARISVLGHSAAGQLAAMVAATRWDDHLPGAPKQILHACIGVSGFYDIEPFPRTHFQDFTRFPLEDYTTWNPLRHASARFPSTLLVTGEKESSLLHQMSGHFAAVLEGHGVSVEQIAAPDECHFSVLHEIGRSGSSLFGRVLTMIR